MRLLARAMVNVHKGLIKRMNALDWLFFWRTLKDHPLIGDDSEHLGDAKPQYLKLLQGLLEKTGSNTETAAQACGIINKEAATWRFRGFITSGSM